MRVSFFEPKRYSKLVFRINNTISIVFQFLSDAEELKLYDLEKKLSIDTLDCFYSLKVDTIFCKHKKLYFSSEGGALNFDIGSNEG